MLLSRFGQTHMLNRNAFRSLAQRLPRLFPVFSPDSRPHGLSKPDRMAMAGGVLSSVFQVDIEEAASRALSATPREASSRMLVTDSKDFRHGSGIRLDGVSARSVNSFIRDPRVLPGLPIAVVQASSTFAMTNTCSAGNRVCESRHDSAGIHPQRTTGYLVGARWNPTVNNSLGA